MPPEDLPPVTPSPVTTSPATNSPSSTSPRLTPGVMAVVVMFVVLVAGFFAGVAVDRGYRHHVLMFTMHGGPRYVPGGPMPPMEPGPEGSRPRPRVVDHFMRALDLTPAQASALDTIMAQDFTAVRSLREAMQPKVDSVVAVTRQRIDSVLTPAQRERYHAMLRVHEHMEWHGRLGAPEGPPPAGP